MITGGYVLGEVLTLLRITVGAGALLLIIAGVLFACMRMGKKRVYLLFPVFLLLGFFRMELEDAGIREREGWGIEGGFGEAKGKVSGIRIKEDTLSLTLEQVTIKGKDGNYSLPRLLVYVYESQGAEKGFMPGDEVLVKGKIKRFKKPRNPGEFNARLYYYSIKLEYSMTADSVKTVGQENRGYRAVLYQFRSACLSLLEKITQPEDTGIFKAALLGEKDSMEEEIKDLYQKNGIAHLLAISGLHVSIIGMGAYHILRKAGMGYGASGIACCVMLYLYSIVSGESPSVLRAVIMIFCQCLANYLGRTYDLVSAACLAAILLLWDSPYYLFQGGVQLSFGAVLGIGIVGRYLTSVFEGGNNLFNTILVSLAIQLVTYPMILYHFFQFPMYGIFLNLLVVPLMAYVIYSGIAGLILGSFSLAAGIYAIGGGHYILALYLWLCRVFSLLPGNNAILGRPGLSAILLYVVLGIFGLGAIKRFEEKWKKLLVLSVTLLLCFFSLMPQPVKGLEVTFLDVGQGDGIVIRTADCTVLVDGGSSSEKNLGSYRLEPYLKSQGIAVLDYAIVSHGDLDHVSGLLYLLNEDTGIFVKNILLPCLGRRDEAYDSLREAGEKHGSVVSYMAQGDSLSKGDLRFDCLYPGWQDTASDVNDQSAMYRVSYKSFGMLLTGDMSSEGEEKMLKDHMLSSFQVLKAGHHGSKTSTGQKLIDTVPFQWAVLSYGEGNSYGHPHKEVTERLTAAGIRQWETARSGAVTLKTDGRRIEWREFVVP